VRNPILILARMGEILLLKKGGKRKQENAKGVLAEVISLQKVFLL